MLPGGRRPASVSIAILTSLACLGTADLQACESGAAASGGCGALEPVQERQPSLSLLQHSQADRRHRAGDRKAVSKILKARVSFKSRDPVENPCPTVAPLTVFDGFSKEEYVRASWYVQEQQVDYWQQTPSQFSCAVHTYDDLGQVSGDLNTIPFFGNGALAVYLYNGGPNFTRSLDEAGKPKKVMCAGQPNSTRAVLRWVPCFLPEIFARNVWVVAIGVDGNNQYEWAVVSGGQPQVHYSDGGCTTKSGFNVTADSGLWILSRTTILSPDKLVDAKNTLLSLGYTLSQLQPVNQGIAKGCTYLGAYIKQNVYVVSA